MWVSVLCDVLSGLPADEGESEMNKKFLRVVEKSGNLAIAKSVKKTQLLTNSVTIRGNSIFNCHGVL